MEQEQILVTGAELARLANVTRSAITQALWKRKIHREENGLFDLNHPKNIRYVKNQVFPRNGRPRRISQRAGRTRKPKE